MFCILSSYAFIESKETAIVNDETYVQEVKINDIINKMEYMKNIAFSLMIFGLLVCSCQNNKTVSKPSQETEMHDTLAPMPKEQMSDNSNDKSSSEAIDSTKTSVDKITEEMAYEGVSNYCHKEYDWSIADKNPSIMYVTMGDGTKSEYKVIFRSYTGSFRYFYVNKTSGVTRMVDYVPGPEIEEEAGTIDLFEYLGKKN